MIQEFKEEASGFFPLMFEKTWQVAILNFLESQRLSAIDKVEVHYETDEVFLLQQGKAVLLIAVLEDNTVKSWESHILSPGVIYNVPRACWHNVIMSEDAKIFIVENADTHKKDVTYHMLSQLERQAMQKCVKSIDIQ